MEIFGSEMFPNKDQSSLESFLRYCYALSVNKNHFQLASIRLKIKSNDPFNFLASMYEKDSIHCYIEHPISGESNLGVGAVLSQTFSGKDRFAKVKEFSENVIENTITFSNLDPAFSGPRFFTAFTFFDNLESKERNSFAPARVFVPLWQFSKNSSGFSIVVNILINQNSNIAQIIEKIWSGYQKILTVSQGSLPVIHQKHADIFEIEDVGGKTYFENSVTKAISEIKKGKYNKIVLARAVDLKSKQAFDTLQSINKLRKKFSNSYILSFAENKGKSFIAATPEKLLTVIENQIQTHALAGSAPRGKTESEDNDYGYNLLNSEKNQYEHRLVVDFILQNFSKINISATASNWQDLIKLKNVQHIQTSISANLIGNQHILDIVAILHPTPAVGGIPVDIACNSIKEIENFDRGLYAGIIGWFDYKRNGQMLVAIRSALIEENQARLFVGAGIVKDSDPKKEKAETDLKLEALLLSI